MGVFSLGHKLFIPSEIGSVGSLTIVGVSINVSYPITNYQIHKPN